MHTTRVLDGLQYAHRFRDPSCGLCDVTCDERLAREAAGSRCETVLAEYEDGCVMRVFPYEATDLSDVARGLIRFFGHGSAHPTQPIDGLGHAYRYRNPRTGAIRWAMDPVLAGLASDGGYETVWVVYRNGNVDHVASREEYQEELEVRIGEDVAATLTQQQVEDFESIDDEDASVRWVIENVPNAHEIVYRNRHEMKQATVLDTATTLRHRSALLDSRTV